MALLLDFEAFQTEVPLRWHGSFKSAVVELELADVGDAGIGYRLGETGASGVEVNRLPDMGGRSTTPVRHGNTRGVFLWVDIR